MNTANIDGIHDLIKVMPILCEKVPCYLTAVARSYPDGQSINAGQFQVKVKVNSSILFKVSVFLGFF